MPRVEPVVLLRVTKLLPSQNSELAATIKHTTVTHAKGGSVPPLLMALPSRQAYGSHEMSVGPTQHSGGKALKAAAQSEMFGAPNPKLPVPVFVIVGARGATGLFGSTVQSITSLTPTARITAINEDTMQHLQTRQRHQIRRFGVAMFQSAKQKRLMNIISSPITPVDLSQNRLGDTPQLVFLQGHSAPGANLVSHIPMTEIAASLKAGGLQNHDVVILGACFGADSFNCNSIDVRKLDRSANGVGRNGERFLPPAQHLVNALGEIGLTGCVVLATHNASTVIQPKNSITRKIRLHERAPYRFSQTRDGTRAPLLDTTRVFHYGAKPSPLLMLTSAETRDRVRPALDYLKALQPPELVSGFEEFSD